MRIRNVHHKGKRKFFEVADILDVRRATVSDLLNEKAALSLEMALRWEKAFGVSMDMMLRMQAVYDAARMRRNAAAINVKRMGQLEGRDGDGPCRSAP